MASAYVEDIARFQAHRFVGGIAPIKSICRVSSAAAQLLAIPKQQLYQRSSGGEGAGAAVRLLLQQAFCSAFFRGPDHSYLRSGWLLQAAAEACPWPLWQMKTSGARCSAAWRALCVRWHLRR